MPFYALGSVGLQGMFFADLGADKIPWTNQKGEAGETLGSKSLNVYIDEFLDPAKPLNWKKRELKRSSKTALLCLMAQMLDASNPVEAMNLFVAKKEGLKQH